MADPVAICNLALGWLGAKLITSLDDRANEARLCKAGFDLARDAVLEARQWTFATDRAELAADAEPPVWGWSHRYALPANTLRVISCDDGSWAGRLRWVRERGYILADHAGPIYARVILRIEDPAEWSPGFTRALAARLAADLAVPLAENRALQADMLQLYAAEIREAAARDGMQGRTDRVHPSPLADRRR